MAKQAEVQQKMRIKIRSYDHRIIDNSCRLIMETASRYGVKMLGPIPLPTEKKRYTVNRSTFIDKNSREQFEMRLHKRLIDIIDPSAKVIEALMNLNLPAGTDVEVKMV